jgi:hypothetical protein
MELSDSGGLLGGRWLSVEVSYFVRGSVLLHLKADLTGIC